MTYLVGVGGEAPPPILAMILFGFELVVPLNGGSEERRAVRQHYREMARRSNVIECIDTAYQVVLRRRR